MANKLPFLTPPQAAKLAGVNEETIRRWCTAGYVEHGTVAGQTAIYRESLEAYLSAYQTYKTPANRTNKLGSRKRYKDGVIELADNSNNRNGRYLSRHTIITDRPSLDEFDIERNRTILNTRAKLAKTAVLLDAQGNPIGHIERKS